MIFKNEAKNYLLTGLICFLVYGLCMSILFGIVLGLGAGLFFAIMMVVVLSAQSSSLEKCFEQTRYNISKTERINCEGPATYNEGTAKIPGWIFYTDSGLIFYSKKDISTPKLTISKSDILNTTSNKGNLLTIQTGLGVHTFVVVKADSWRNVMTASIKEPVNNQSSAIPKVENVSSADELKKYKDLLDSGVLTQEEFDAKKKQLLGL